MRRSLVPCILVGIVVLGALGCDPPRTQTLLTATPEAVTLIQDAEALCAKAGKAAVESYRGQNVQSRSGGDLVRFLHQYVEGEGAPEMAAIDKADELVADLMPKVREESETGVVKAVEDLLAGQKRVCTAARTGSYTPLEYQDKLKYATNEYLEARDKLAALYTVPDADAQFARRKFSPQLEEARASARPAEPESPVRVASAEQYDRERQEWEKTQEYQARQQAEHDAAVDRWRAREEDGEGKRQPLVGTVTASSAQAARSPQTAQAWNTAYAARVTPVRTALESYLEVRRGEPEEVRPVCQELLDATTALLADPAAMETPDRMANQALKRAYAELRECAQSCTTNHNAEAAFRLAAYQTALRDATAALRPYGVAP